ncbi:MAG: hypothetical protein WHT29_02685 [Bacteroidales bacterium]|nr:hypothetical protein [Bacteroidales bacterium]
MAKYRVFTVEMFFSTILYSGEVFYYFVRNRGIYHRTLKEKLNEKSIRGRIRAYLQKIGMFVIPFFESLGGKKLSMDQKQKLLLAGVLTPLFDDAIESNNLNQYLAVIKKLPVKLSDPKINLFSKAYHTLMVGVKDQYAFHQKLQNIVEIETVPSSPYKKIEKGSKALQLYAICANLEINEYQNDFIARAGAFFQLIDDIYDYKIDKNKGIETLPIILRNENKKLVKFLNLLFLRLIQHPVLNCLPNKNKKTIEGMLFLLYCLAIVRIKIS